MGFVLRAVALAVVCSVTGLHAFFGISLLPAIGHAPGLAVLTIGLFVVSLLHWVVRGVSGRTLLLFALLGASWAATIGMCRATQDSGWEAEAIPEKMRRAAGVALVTGSTRGIGLEATRLLAEAGFEVFVHGRTVAAMRAAVEQLPPQLQSRAIVLDVGADMASFASVDAFVKALKAHPKSQGLSLLVSNAGVGEQNATAKTVDGFDLTAQSNYLAGERIFRLLLPELTRNRGRVVHVPSAMFFAPGPRELIPEFSEAVPSNSYGRSKLLQVIGAKIAAQKHPELRVVAAHPGVCWSEMTRVGPRARFDKLVPFPVLSFLVPHLAEAVFFPASYCAKCVLYGAFSDDLSSGEITQAYTAIRPWSFSLPPYPSSYFTSDMLAKVDAATRAALPPSTA
jgi:NAD(P)-dependent dehydrogenase (short-subunit alcohol dehydrogenase family)